MNKKYIVSFVYNGIFGYAFIAKPKTLGGNIMYIHSYYRWKRLSNAKKAWIKTAKQLGIKKWSFSDEQN